MSPQLLWSLLLCLCSGCFRSEIPEGALRCDETSSRPCPAGMVCRAGHCYGSQGPADLGRDLTADLAAREMGADVGPDTGRDASAPVTCGAPTVVGNATDELWEPALRADGLTLIARRAQVGYFMTSRTSKDTPFGDWVAADLLLDADDDLTFFSAQGQERAIQAVTPASIRHLQLCELDNTCAAITLVERDGGASIDDDVDGPSVADTLVEPLLVFNRTDTLWIASPTTPGALDHWTADPLPFTGGDPAISPDGLIVVFEKKANGQADIWLAERASVEMPFSEPRLLDEVSDAVVGDLEPELGALPDGGVELFFRSDRGSFSEVYRSVCR